MNDGSLRYISEPPQVPLLDIPHRKPFLSIKKAVIGFMSLLLLAIMFELCFGAPNRFPTNTIFSVPAGQSISGVAAELRDMNAIKSEFLFKASLVIFGGRYGLKAGDYFLESKQNTLSIAWRISHSEYDLKNIKVTIPEGWSSGEIASFIAKDKRFSHFVVKDFLKLSEKYEGYLFPDTYLFLPNVTAQNVLDAMIANYQERITSISSEIAAFGKPIKDIIIMASIIEEEARTEESRRIIAGILWKRLSDGMPLQVDAAFAFVNGKKASSLLTLDDLKIDSPYNTYVYKGLPPGPISNPGLDSILATVRPIQTKYYFYLTDNAGNMRYGITHDEHVENKFRYLK